MFAFVRPVLTFVVLTAAIGTVRGDPPTQPVSAKFSYPSATRENTGDTYNNTWVSDPYRWLEQHDSSATTTWLDAQASLTRHYLDSIDNRKQILDTLRETTDYERRSIPVYVGGKFYFRKNSGLQEQDSVCRNSGPGTKDEIVLDAGKLWGDNKKSLKNFSVNSDGKYLAYAVSILGSDVTQWKVLEIATGKELPETITASFSYPYWSARALGFYYDNSSKIYFHNLNTDQANDQLIYSDSWSSYGQITTTGNNLIITQSQGTSKTCRVLVRDLVSDSKTVSWLFPNADAQYEYICEKDDVLYFTTTLHAPKGCIIKISLKDKSTYTEVVAQSQDALEDVTYAQDKLFANYLRQGHSVVKVFALDGRLLAQMDLPGAGSAASFRTDGTADGVLYTYSDYVTPATVFRYATSGASKDWKSTVYFRPTLKFDVSAFKQEVVTFKSKDGTLVPITLAYRKDLVKDGKNPVLLYGYGGFNYSLTPYYRSTYAAWMRLGGVLAVPNLRGGAEGGEDWHEAGVKLKKQNVFDDCLAAAHWLIDQKYTAAGKIVVSGASNGGLLVGAVLTQEPDLFGAALPHVGVLDMIRFPLFSVGSGWQVEYGNPTDAAEFAALYAYSPLHKVTKGTKYPAVLVSTCDHDDRVEQSHSWKFTATLQYAQAADRPVMLLVGKDAGHLYGWNTTKSLEFEADRYAFALANLR